MSNEKGGTPSCLAFKFYGVENEGIQDAYHEGYYHIWVYAQEGSNATILRPTLSFYAWERTTVNFWTDDYWFDDDLNNDIIDYLQRDTSAW